MRNFRNDAALVWIFQFSLYFRYVTWQLEYHDVIATWFNIPRSAYFTVQIKLYQVVLKLKSVWITETTKYDDDFEKSLVCSTPIKQSEDGSVRSLISVSERVRKTASVIHTENSTFYKSDSELEVESCSFWSVIKVLKYLLYAVC